MLDWESMVNLSNGLFRISLLDDQLGRNDCFDELMVIWECIIRLVELGKDLCLVRFHVHLHFRLIS